MVWVSMALRITQTVIGLFIVIIKPMTTLSNAQPCVAQAIDAFLIAAGRGSRLGNLTLHTPKCLVPIAGTPLLGYWLKQLHESPKIGRIFINLHYLAEHVQEFIEKSPHNSKVVPIHEPALLGTGGSLANLLHRYGPFSSDLFVAHADNLSLFNLSVFINRHRTRPGFCLATAMTFTSDRLQSCGILELDSTGVVTRLHEKVANPPGQLANGAVFLFSVQALALAKSLFSGSPRHPDGLWDLSRDLLPELLGRLWTFHNDTYHRDIGTYESLAQAEKDFPDLFRLFSMGSFQP